ncbi:hypothetical protein AC249_AIPGENE2746 [Exaiptasia diaphana]|nr:hypothetical protein AC249_AIPGENE2746 [Exaiptasia diaphana]
MPPSYCRIGAIMDMDGYMVDKEFIPKELSIKALGSLEPFTCHFLNVGRPFRTLSKRDQKVADFVYENIFSIAYDKYFFGQLLPASIMNVLRCVSHENVVVAYKGGRYERELLDRLEIESFNLEDIGCPKVELIQPNREYTVCGHHDRDDDHCSTTEVNLSIQQPHNG